MYPTRAETSLFRTVAPSPRQYSARNSRRQADQRPLRHDDRLPGRQSAGVDADRGPAPLGIRLAPSIHAIECRWFRARWHSSFDEYYDPETMGLGTLCGVRRSREYTPCPRRYTP